MNFTSLTAIAVSIFVFSTVGIAQAPEKAKTGDRLGVETLRYDTRGREIYVASTTKGSIALLITANERVFNWDNGPTQKYDPNYTLVERTSGGVTTPTEARSQLKFLHLDGDPRTKKEVTNTYKSNAAHCGTVVATYVSEGKDVSYALTVRGKQTELKAVEVLLDGKWSAACGTGKQSVKVTYSPELDPLLTYEYLNFLPSGILNSGIGWRVTSLD